MILHLHYDCNKLKNLRFLNMSEFEEKKKKGILRSNDTESKFWNKINN